MGLDDFERCTPSEFWQIHGAWQECFCNTQRGSWERVRMMCLCMLQPYSKKPLKASDVMVFPWDTEVEKPGSCECRRDESREELLAMLEMVKKERGLL